MILFTGWLCFDVWALANRQSSLTRHLVWFVATPNNSCGTRNKTLLTAFCYRGYSSSSYLCVKWRKENTWSRPPQSLSLPQNCVSFPTARRWNLSWFTGILFSFSTPISSEILFNIIFLSTLNFSEWSAPYRFFRSNICKQFSSLPRKKKFRGIRFRECLLQSTPLTLSSLFMRVRTISKGDY